jgi:hypothetical protein
MHKRVILGSFLAAGIFPLGIYLFNFHGSLSPEHQEWAEFGSYVSGAYGAFAFLILAYTTNLTRRQFQIQNQDNFFFKLHDSLESRIANNTVVVGNTMYTAHQTLKVVAERFHEELSAIHTPMNFYQMPFAERRRHYNTVVQRISGDYGEFLDGYFRNICFLVEFATSAVNKNRYIDFLKAQFTQHELIILFYLAAGRDGPLGNIKNLRDLGILDGLLTINRRSLIVGLLSNEEFKHEIDSVFSDE